MGNARSSFSYRVWAAGVLAALALLLVAVAAAVPFLDELPAGMAGSIATLVIAAEILAALAILVGGKAMYATLRAKLQSLREELSEKPSKEKHHE